MKKLLVISYYWPPSGGSGVQRWVKMCKYLPDYGWQPVVYTPLNPAVDLKDDTLGNDLPPEVQVIRRKILEPGQFAKKSTGAQVTPINAQKKSFKQKVAMWVRGNCFIPDPRVMWVRPSVNFLLKYLKEHPVDAIVSTGPPHSMHLIAEALSEKTGLPWLADFRDPWTKMFYFKHLSLTTCSEKKHHRMEQSVLDSATRVVAVSPLVQDDFKAMTTTPVELITNGYDSADFEESFGIEADKDHFVLVHAGLFASDGNPLCLWAALSELAAECPEFKEKLIIRLCGKTDAAVLKAIKEAGFEENLENLGYLDHGRTVSLMRSASALMLPLRQEPEYKATLPGKLFEYLASRRPVLGIGQRDGAMARILSDTGAGSTFEWSQQQELKLYVKELFERFKSGKLDDNKADISKYSRESLSAQYASLLDEITK